MRRLIQTILVAAAVGLLAAAASAEPPDDAGRLLTRAPRGSLARQLRLKLRLDMAGGPSLAASLDHNRQEWEMLSPDQREQFRRYALAYLKKNPTQQEKLMKSYSSFLSLTKTKQAAYRRRAKWVKAVVASFTPEQRKQLREMPPTDRAKALIARRDELVRQGKLRLDEPATPSPEPAKD